MKYRIPLGDIIDFSTEGKVLKYYVHLVYGTQDRQYQASIDFTTKSDGQMFTSLLNLAIDVDRKRLDLERKYTGMSDEVNYWKQQISELDSENKSLSEEKEKIEYAYKNENDGLNGKLQKELNDVYVIKKQLKQQEKDLQNIIIEEKSKLQDYKTQELATLDESKRHL
ncbi:TPA: hypothetical protein PPU89_002261 [Staphylococcus aureus]|uniref:hypothetical protein n=1 Tax=Staphylococcus chromogenes TaxID=46126 RepID=UPI001F3CEEB4|nr:hypothetical protein [Staphylococcus chromogenes]MCE4962642.1 hypothetical protein [Staphylococcus chromogenes]HDJ2072611.1 hypothetical protein [Staphylococcus aureus]